MTEISQLKVCIFIINKPHLPEKKTGKSRSRGEVIAGKLRHRVPAAERGWGRQQGRAFLPQDALALHSSQGKEEAQQVEEEATGRTETFVPNRAIAGATQ